VTRVRRPSSQTMAVLRALAEDPERWRYGYDLCAQLGIQAGSMYPILMRLADRGLLETSWETERVPGRPARHLYRLTGAGHAFAGAAAAAASAAAAAPAPAPVPAAPRSRLQGA
jgi:PadR family transcriptional regulator, regulatory protein PadR